MAVSSLKASHPEQVFTRWDQKYAAYQQQASSLQSNPTSAESSKNYLNAYYDLKCDLKTELVWHQALGETTTPVPTKAVEWALSLKQSHQTIKQSIVSFPIQLSEHSLAVQIDQCRAFLTNYGQLYLKLPTSNNLKTDFQETLKAYYTLKTSLRALQHSLPPLASCHAVVEQFKQKMRELHRRPLPQTSYLLDPSLLEQSKRYLDDPEKLEILPRAHGGATPVFLPPGLPVVLKQSGSPQNATRLEKMRRARALSNQFGYKYLTFPSGQIYRNFIVESRLPIRYFDLKDSIGFYLENHMKFKEAARELIHFLCQVSLRNIVGANDPHAYLTGTDHPTDCPRYDNICPYIDADQQGKLGMVDLERLELDFHPSIFESCRDVIHFFPHHLDVILQTAIQFDPNIERYRERFEKIQSEIFAFFRLVYLNHAEFAQQNNIGLANPSQIIPISPERKEELKPLLAASLIESNFSLLYPLFLGENPSETLELFKEVVPEILDELMLFIQKSLESNIEYAGGSTAMTSIPKLLATRTIMFFDPSYKEQSYGPSQSYWELKKSLNSKLTMLIPGNKVNNKMYMISFNNDCINHIIKSAFTQLAGKEIAYYNPYFFSYNHSERMCIFC